MSGILLCDVSCIMSDILVFLLVGFAEGEVEICHGQTRTGLTIIGYTVELSRQGLTPSRFSVKPNE